METCDKCGPAVRAERRFTLPNGHSLAFCAHDSDSIGAKLVTGGAILSHVDDAIPVPEMAGTR